MDRTRPTVPAPWLGAVLGLGEAGLVPKPGGTGMLLLGEGIGLIALRVERAAVPPWTEDATSSSTLGRTMGSPAPTVCGSGSGGFGAVLFDRGGICACLPVRIRSSFRNHCARSKEGTLA